MCIDLPVAKRTLQKAASLPFKREKNSHFCWIFVGNDRKSNWRILKWKVVLKIRFVFSPWYYSWNAAELFWPLRWNVALYVVILFPRIWFLYSTAYSSAITIELMKKGNENYIAFSFNGKYFSIPGCTSPTMSDLLCPVSQFTSMCRSFKPTTEECLGTLKEEGFSFLFLFLFSFSFSFSFLVFIAF